MQVIKTKLSDALIIEPKIFSDDRGYFLETHNAQRYIESGLNVKFVQDNFSCSDKNVLRGMHFQKKYPQGKLVSVSLGKVFDVIVDLRPNSPTFGEWLGVELDDQSHRQLYVPPGFAHGFYVLSDRAHFHYKCTDYYHPEDEGGIIWNDETINIDWPLQGEPVVSEKDQAYSGLSDLKRGIFCDVST
ncbi:MAG: dTDP-4-dehydrorhamnose 3,5-epimerase [Gammaproteobacteria bacterium]